MVMNLLRWRGTREQGPPLRLRRWRRVQKDLWVRLGRHSDLPRLNDCSSKSSGSRAPGVNSLSDMHFIPMAPDSARGGASGT